MSSRLFRCLTTNLIIPNAQQIRGGHHVRGKPPGVALTLQQRLAEMNTEDPELSFKVDIGFKCQKLSRAQLSSGYMEQVKQMRSKNELERKARNKELIIDLEEIQEDIWKTNGSQQLKTIADHYNVYKDLFGDAYFYPALPLNIMYDYGDEGKLAPVYRGNFLSSRETHNAPTVTYNAKPDSLWTLLLTTPDCNFTNNELEYCHWFIGNIPGNDLEKGDLLVDYMRPIPPRGAGYCRYIFVLYKQNEKIDFSEYKKTQPCLELQERNWSTLEFYRKYQDILTPAGLAFYQSEWDKSLQDFYHNILQMKSPVFEYDFPEPYIRPQEWFPLRQPFNLYMDKYRDPKQINKEHLLKKLKKTHPFNGPDKPLKFPSAHEIPYRTPSWLSYEMRKERQGWGRMNEIN